MAKVCGKLDEVGYLQNGKIPVIRIGGATLRNSRCEPSLWQRLVPGQNLCLYLYKHLFYKPVILGVASVETGEKFLMPSVVCRNSCLQLLVMYGLGWIFGMLILGGMIVGALGGNPEAYGGLFAAIGAGIALYLTVRFWLDYRAAQAD